MSTSSNWHRWAYGALAATLGLLVLIQTGAIPVLAALPASWTWAPLVLMCLVAFLKMLLPQIQTPAQPLIPPTTVALPIPALPSVIPLNAAAAASDPNLKPIPPPTLPPPGDSNAVPR